MAIHKLIKIKKDQYQATRGGYSRLLKITCEGCGEFLGIYQKDGPGHLRRVYLDRLHVSKLKRGMSPSCPACGRVIGTKIEFKKENRPAIRLYVDSVVKKFVSIKDASKSLHKS